MQRDGKALQKPDASEERAIHVMGPHGPRNALKRVDYVEAPVTVTFTARWLDDGVVDDELLKTLLEYAGWNGLGADRSTGSGQFEVLTLGPTSSDKPGHTIPSPSDPALTSRT